MTQVGLKLGDWLKVCGSKWVPSSSYLFLLPVEGCVVLCEETGPHELWTQGCQAQLRREIC